MNQPSRDGRGRRTTATLYEAVPVAGRRCSGVCTSRQLKRREAIRRLDEPSGTRLPATVISDALRPCDEAHSGPRSAGNHSADGNKSPHRGSHLRTGASFLYGVVLGRVERRRLEEATTRPRRDKS